MSTDEWSGNDHEWSGAVPRAGGNDCTTSSGQHYLICAYCRTAIIMCHCPTHRNHDVGYVCFNCQARPCIHFLDILDSRSAWKRRGEAYAF